MRKDKSLVTLSREVTDDIDKRRKEEDFNFSNWIETTYIRENMTESGLKKQVNYHKKELEKAKNRVNHLKRNHKKWVTLLKRNLNNLQKTELEKSKELLKTNPNLLNGRLNLWNNETRFKSKSESKRLTKSEFMELMEI